MNPSYIAYNKALLATLMNTMMGIEPPAPKAKKDPNVGPAFAPGGGGIKQDEPSEEKEDKVRAHLDKLAAECKQRYLDGLDELPYVEEMTQSQSTDKWVKREMKRNRDLHTGREYLPDEPDPIHFPRSDLIVLAEEEQDRRDRITFNTKADSKVMTALYGSDNDAKIDDLTPHDIVIAELHKTHEAYIQRRIELNRMGERYNATAEEEYPSVTIAQTGEMDKATYDQATKALLKLANITEIHDSYTDEPKYPRSDMVEEAEEAQAEAEAHVPLSDRIAKACVHSGERVNLNYDNYTDEAL